MHHIDRRPFQRWLAAPIQKQNDPEFTKTALVPDLGIPGPAGAPLRRMRLAVRAGGSGRLHRGNAERRVMPGEKFAIWRWLREFDYRFPGLCHRATPNLAIASIGQVSRRKLNSGLMKCGRNQAEGRFSESRNAGLIPWISAWRALPAAQRRACPIRAAAERRSRRAQTGQGRLQWRLPQPDGIPPHRRGQEADGFRRPPPA